MSQQRKKAVGYVRVSTDMQVKEGQSIEAQKDDIMRHCIYKQYDFLRHYTDEGLSGKNMQRPQLNLMLEEIQPGTVIITKSLSRLSRSVEDMINITKDIESKKCSLVILDLDIDTSTAAGDLMLNVMGAIGQFERKNTAEKVSSTLTHMSREGKLITKPRFGYKVIKDGKISQIVEDEDEQKIINTIRNYIQEDNRIPTSVIARALTRDGFTVRKSKSIYPSFVNKIIRDNNLR